MGYGFLEDLIGDSGANATNEANNNVTAYGGLDALAKEGGKAGNTGLPGSSVLGHVGGALSMLGLANDAVDIDKRGLNGENGLSALGNGAGAGSWIAGLVSSALTPAAGAGGAGAGAAGAAGAGAGATVAAGIGGTLAAFAGGLALGNGSNNYIAKQGTLGENVDGSNRSWSGMAADWGSGAESGVESLVGDGHLGTAAGIAGTLAGSYVGAAATAAMAPVVVGDMAVELGGAGIDLAGDLWNSVWD